MRDAAVAVQDMGEGEEAELGGSESGRAEGIRFASEYAVTNA